MPLKFHRWSRFRRGCRLGCRRPRSQRRVRPIWLGLLVALLLVLLGLGVSPPAHSQLVSTDPTATVVVNGRKVLEVRGVPNFTAAERARSINERLQEEVRGAEPPVIDVVVEDEAGLVYLQSRASGALLATVTEADLVTPGYQLQRQARDWAELIETALRQGQLERRSAYLQQALLFAMVVLAVAIALHLALRIISDRSQRLLNRWFSSPTHPLTTWERPIQVFWRLGLLGLKASLWLTVTLYITDLFPQIRSWRHIVSTLLTAKSITVGENQYSALSLLLLLGLTIGLWFAARLIARLFRTYVLRRARVEPRLQDILSVLVQYVLLFLGVLILLQLLGIDASSLAILASLLGVGIGFGVQNITNNFISGFIITLERPIQVGDFIKIGDLVGIVKQVGARSTEINTLDQVTIIVPNSRFLESEVINWSHGNPISRLRVPVSVAYGSDITQVKNALLEAVKRHPEVLLRPEPEIWFQSFGDSALNFEIMVWTGEPRKQFRVKSDLNYAIEANIRHHGIEVPFPQQDLHLRSPQLDDILELLKQQAIEASEPGLSKPGLSKPGFSKPGFSQPGLSQLSNAASAFPQVSPTPPALSAAPPLQPAPEPVPDQPSSLPDLVADLDLEALADAMQGPQGVNFQPHPDQPAIQSTYFTGTASVEWLKQQRDYTHAGAMVVGQWLLHKGLISATSEGQDFEDSQALYQFYQDSPAALGKDIGSPADPVPSDQDVTDPTTDLT